MKPILSIEIAERFLEHAQVDLAVFITIEDAAAHALARHRGNLDLSPLPQNLWVKTGIIALRSGARFLEVVHNRPIREWV
jgi:hypothetical protein